MKIFKYVLTEAVQVTGLPAGAVILAVQAQRDEVCVWALVDPDAKRQLVTFHTVPTGAEFDPAGKTYLDTVQMLQGRLVLHIFAEGLALGVGNS